MTPEASGPGAPAPFRSGPFRVRPEWIDSNGHLNLAHYVTIFDYATDALWPTLELGDAFRAQDHGTFAAETHTLYKAELLEGETATVLSQVIAIDGKRLHVTHTMLRERDGVVSAQQELMYLCVDLRTRKVVTWPPATRLRLDAVAAAHARLPRPDWIGRTLAMPGAASPSASTAPAPG